MCDMDLLSIEKHIATRIWGGNFWLLYCKVEENLYNYGYSDIKEHIKWIKKQPRKLMTLFNNEIWILIDPEGKKHEFDHWDKLKAYTEGMHLHLTERTITE